MKFVCDRCQTRYSVADEKVRQRILRIRCKTCGNVITVQAGEVVPGPADASRRPEPAASAGSTPPPRPSSRLSRPLSGLHEWFVSVDGAERGPLSCTDAAKYIVSCKPEQSIHVWKEGMDGWKRPKDVAIIAQEITALRLPPAGPSPPAPVRADTSSALRPAPSAPGVQAPGVRPKPPAGGLGSGPKLPQPGSGLKLSSTIPGSGPKPPPVPGSGAKAAPPPIPGSGPKAPPPVPGSGPKPAPAGGSGPERARPRISGSQSVPGMTGSEPKLPSPTAGSGARSPQSVLPDSAAETPLPALGADAPHLSPRSVPKLSVVPSPKKGPALPGLTPLSAGLPTPTPAVETEFDKAPTTKPERRKSGTREVSARGPQLPDIAQPTASREQMDADELEQGEKTPPPRKPLPPIVAPGPDGHAGKDSRLSAFAPALPPPLPQPFDWSGTGSAAAATMNPSAKLAPPAGSLFGNVAALPATLFPAAHDEAGLSKLTGLATLARRHRHLKYVIAAGIVVVLVILVILLSWRGESGKAAGSILRRAAPVAPAPPSGEVEPPAQEVTTSEPEARPKVRAAARSASKRSAVVHSAGPSGKAAAVGEDPFERSSARSHSVERPVPVETPSRSRPPRSGPSGREVGAISQSQISEVVRNKGNQAGLKSCYERALKRDGQLRAGRLDITVSIGETGVVQNVQVHGSSDFLLIDGCIKNAIRHWRFPANVEEYATSFPLILQGG